METAHGGLRTLAGVALPGATRARPDTSPATATGFAAPDPAVAPVPTRLAGEP
jgi:hypothetical protein